jgi:hypothetical protein
MFWRRYRRELLWSIPIAAVVGVVLALIVYLGGNPDYRAYSGWGGLASLLLVAVLATSGTGVAALCAGSIAVFVVDRTFQRSALFRIVAGTLGAAAGAALVWIAVGVVNAIAAPTGASWLGVSSMIASVSAAIAGTVAVVMLNRAEMRASRQTSSAPASASR